jgi:hypothetical protein
MNVRGDFEEALASSSVAPPRSIARPEFRKECDALIGELVQSGYANPAFARLLAPEAFSRDFFVRSTIENVLRIDLMRAINPLACTLLAKVDPVLCKQYGVYGADEGLHDRMFARDLVAMGLTEEDIYNTKPLFSTQLLAGWLHYTIQNGDPLATVASAYYVESMSVMTQPAWIEKMEAHLGSGALKGSRAHVNQDIHEGHIDVAWNMCMRLLKTPQDDALFIAHVRKLHSLFIAYLLEICNVVFDGKPEDGNVSTGAVRAYHDA